ncbi:MAG TPA: hypothetical protein VKI99_18790 [Candidatus Dormibacteraeota bacterium]|nr:hypothetical protein [Candidatus Dormibacteraeota bacterium]
MDLRLVEYVLYLTVSICLTVWVGRALQQNGRQFLAEVLTDRALAASLSRLLVVAFYLVALGGVALLLQVDVALTSAADVIRAVATKVGLVLLLLGALHLIAMLALHRMRGRAPVAARRPADHERLATLGEALR